MDNIEEQINSIRDTLVFLIEQEKVRQEEVMALNERIDAVNNYMMDNIVNPSIDAYKEEQFNAFNDKYGERLGKYNDTLKLSLNDPEYDATREAWNELEALPEDERAGVDEDAYISGVEEGLNEYVDNIKQTLGIPADAAVEIKDDGNGNVEVAADTNGDGEVDTNVTEEAPAPEAKDVEAPEEDSEPTQDELEAYLRGDDMKKDKEDKE